MVKKSSNSEDQARDSVLRTMLSMKPNPKKVAPTKKAGAKKKN